jgi:putative transposase
MSSYKSSNNVTYSCKYHIIWCPKYRRKVLKDEIKARLETIIRDVCIETHSDALEMEVMPDHVHLLCEVDPSYGVMKLVRLCKGRSSRLLREEFPALKTKLPTLWTNSTFISTVGGAPLSAIKQYIQNQPRSEPRRKNNG